MQEVSSRRRVSASTYLLVLVYGALAGLVGSVAHRMGAASNVPYGLLMAFLILLGTSYWSRVHAGAIGLGIHMIAASGLIWLLMGYGPGGDVLIPVASAAFTSFFGSQAGYIWLLGSLIVQVVMLVLPGRWFVCASSEEYLDGAGSPDDTVVGSSELAL